MTEIVVILALTVFLAKMWDRLRALERRLEAVELRPAAALPRHAPASPAADERWWEIAAGRAPEPSSAQEREFEIEPEPEADLAPEPLEFPEPAPIPIAASEPAPEPTPAPASVPGPDPVEAEPEPVRGFGFEELFGRRLPIWAGGVTLAVAGVLIVRYSIEAGLLSPLVRFVAGLIFGTGLIAAAELALRLEEKVRDARVRQALAGAGIATLYASILVGVNLYALIGPMTAFAAMAAVTALAMGLSLRFGAPSALLGLVGGLAAPALVGAGEPNVPLLTLYLGLAVAGLCVLSRAQRWMWLGASALAGGLGWGLVLVVGGALDTAASLSIGLYLLVVGIALPLVALPSTAGKLLRIGGSLAAAAQMAALVASGGFSMLHWGLFGLISIAIIWLSRREEAFARLPAVGLALALILAGAWPDPGVTQFALVMAAAALVYGGPALQALWRPAGGLVEVGQIAALAVGGVFVAAIHFFRTDGSADIALAGASLAAAAFPAAAAALGWRKAERREDRRFSLLACTAALLAGVSACFAIPIETLPLALAAIAAGLLLLSLAAGDRRIEPAAWAGAALAACLFANPAGFEHEAERLLGFGQPIDVVMALVRWIGAAVAALIFAGHGRLAKARVAAQAAGALFAYGAAAQVVPAAYLSLVAPAALLGLALAARRFDSKAMLPALAVALAVTIGWTLVPLLLWATAALASLAGNPLFAGELPQVRDSMQRLLAPALLIAASAQAAARQLEREVRRWAFAAALALGLVAAHVAFKQLVGLEAADFAGWGLAERTLWQALLLGAAAAAWKLGYRRGGLALGAAALAHLVWYSLVLHNPLWAEQAVGRLPLLNLLACIYGLPLAMLALAPRIEPGLFPRLERPRAAAQMLLVVLLAFSTLRQLVHGSILVEPGLSQGEDIARSILAVALAIGFLLWGMRRGSSDWRIGSLVLMLGAVAKVFLLDASGLEGLMRIASFVALGFSLIGIGWLYSRSLSGERAPPRATRETD
ncbi:MAG TPA: DUF2339 domain-containing protein [Allosphingosinicella sp.]